MAAHGRLVASGSDDRTVQVRDLDDDAGPTTFSGYRDKVTALAFLDGTRLAVGTEVGERVVVDLEVDRTLVTLPAASSGVTAMVTWPGAQRLATVDGNRIETWEFDEATWPALACRVAGRGLADDEIEDFLGGLDPASTAC